MRTHTYAYTFTSHNEQLTWKKLEIANGASGISMPADWTEANVTLYLPANPHWTYTFHLVKAQYENENDFTGICNGQHKDNNEYVACSIKVESGGNVIRLNEFYRNGSSVGTVKMTIWYR